MPGIGTAIAGVLTAFKASAIGAFLTGTVAGRLLTTVALSALQAALAPKPRPPGIVTDVTAQGGTNPMGFILGRYATAGSSVCPPMSHGQAGKTPNAYLTYVITLGDIPGQSLEAVFIDGTRVTLGTVPHPDYGLPATGRYAGYAWFKHYDGTQTVADPMLLAKYGAYPERPWLADMVGAGTCYVICTFRFNRELFGGLPTCLFECGGIRVYDPRKDSSVGGSGAHRWALPATWERSLNNAVLAYNIARGITMPGLGIWGGDFAADDLPLSNWFTAMNACDQAVGDPAQPQFQAGYEVLVSMEPAGVIEELLKGCTGQVAEVGGALKIRVGGPGLPVLFITDDDIIVSKPQDYDPFPTADARQNGIDARYPEPLTGWETKSAPPLYNPVWEAEDSERRVASLDLPACPFSRQVQQVMTAYIRDERRFRRHGMTLPPDAAVLEPLDVISWTSARNGYAGKSFEVGEVADDVMTLLQRVSLREVDPADYIWTPASEVPVQVPSSEPVAPPVQLVAGFDALPVAILDATGTARRPAIRMIWDGDQDDVQGIMWEVLIDATSVLAASGSFQNVANGELLIAEGIMGDVAYRVRAQFVADRPTDWTPYEVVTTPNVGISDADFPDGLAQALADAGITGLEHVTALPATGNYLGRVVTFGPEAKLYRHKGAPLDATGWTAATDGADILVNSITGNRVVAGSITANELATANLITNSAQIADALITSAKLAGTIQSSNFVAGVSGWRITVAGAAEFNSLIVRRDMIVLNAVSDKVTETLTSLSAATAGNNVARMPILLGAVAVGDVYFVGFGAVLDPSTTHSLTVVLQRRIQTGGVFGPYEDRYTVTLAANLANRGIGFGEVITGQFQDVEYSFRYVVAGSGNGTGLIVSPAISHQKLVR
jgi:hypothetical protein